MFRLLSFVAIIYYLTVTIYFIDYDKHLDLSKTTSIPTLLMDRYSTRLGLMKAPPS